MKYILIFGFFICTQVRGQESHTDTTPVLSYFPLKDGKIHYEKIIDIDSTSKEELYARAKLWGLNAFTNVKEVSVLDEPEIGVLAYQGYIDKPLLGYKVGRIKVSDARQVWLTTKILIKDNKVKIVFENVKIKSSIYSVAAGTALPTETNWQIESFDEVYKTDSKINRDIKAANRVYFQELSEELKARMLELEGALRRNSDEFSF